MVGTAVKTTRLRNKQMFSLLHTSITFFDILKLVVQIASFFFFCRRNNQIVGKDLQYKKKLKPILDWLDAF